MSTNKYGLDFTLWGNTPKKPEKSSFDSSATIGKGWSNASKSSRVDNDDEQETKPPPPAQSISCTLSDARFLPDTATDFNKPCKVTIDVEGTPKGAISFALWATYKCVDYDLQHEKTAFVTNGKAETELTLFYVGPYYDDYYQKRETDGIVEYYAKVTNKAACEITSDFLQMPCNKQTGFVKVKFISKDKKLISGLTCTLAGCQNQEALISGENGEICWADLPLGEYSVSLTSGEKNRTFYTPWLHNDVNPFEIIIK